MPRSATLTRLRRTLAAERNVRFAYLYGSFLRRRDARDLDLGLYLAGRPSPQTLEDIAGRLEKAAGARLAVDAHVLNGAPAAFAFNVVSTGRLLRETDRQERLAWEAHVLSRYQDIKPMLEFYDRQFLAR